MFLKKTENVIPLEFWIAEDYMSNFVYTAHVTALSMKTTGMTLAIKGKTWFSSVVQGKDTCTLFHM